MDIEERRLKIREYSLKPENKIKRKAYMINYRIEYEKKNKQRISQKKKEYYLKNKERIDNRNKIWHKNNKNKFRIYLNKYYSNPENINRRRETSDNWYRTIDKEEYRNRKRVWEKNKLLKDFNFKTKKLLRSRIISAFKNFSKTGKIRKSKDYGIDYELIIKHLTKILPNDFNEREYHIDHIIPCCSFDLIDNEQVKKCFAPENHQWLSIEEHKKKSILDFKNNLSNVNK